MVNPFYIAHISDLHFGPHHDSDVRKSLLSDLKLYRPKALVVSGDLSQWGKYDELKLAHDFLGEVCRECGINPQTNLFVVPGNHDVDNIGGRFFSAKKLRTFKKFDNLRPMSGYIPELDLAIFTVDSTITAANLAEGRVLPSAVQELKNNIQKLPEEHRSCFKILVMHHHPLPVPHVGSDDFMILRQAGDFLQTLMLEDFDLILYGHRHKEFFSRIRYRIEGRDREISCLGAGTATQQIKEGGINSYNLLHFNGDEVTCRIRKCAFRAHQFSSESATIPLFAASEVGDGLYNRLVSMVGTRQSVLSGELTVETRGSETVNFRSDNLKLEGPESAVFKRPHGWDVDRGQITVGELVDVSCPLGNLDLVVTKKAHDQQSCNWTVQSSEPIPPNRPITYTLRVKTLGCYARTTEELRAASGSSMVEADASENCELFGLTVTVPTDALEVKVNLPRGYRFTPRLRIFAGSEQQPELESKLRSRLRHNEAAASATIEIPRPRLGYTYCIEWTLMNKVQFEVSCLQ